jgi:hypothetical protein
MGNAFGADLLDQRHQRAAFVLGQAARHFVEQQHTRFGRQSAGEFEALAIEQRQAAGAFVRFGDQAATLEQFGAAVVDGGFAFVGAEGRGDHHVLEHGHAGKRLRDLEGTGKAEAAAALRRQVCNVVAGQQHAAGIGRDGARGDAEQGRLAGAVRSDDAERLALGKRQIDAVSHHHRAEALGDIFQSEDGRHGLTFVMRPLHRITKSAPTCRRRGYSARTCSR